MATQISKNILRAVSLLKTGEIIGFPTETVYGLAGMISNENAIKKIFCIKERPLFDPLIVHIANFDDVFKIFETWNTTAEILAKAFWPGAMTIVLNKKTTINTLITSGLETVAVRFPNHPLAQSLIQEVGEPLAAPSANKFGRTSPSQAEHVFNEFKTDNLFILDGGPCLIGVESTVLAPTEDEVIIYRPGMLSKEMLEAALEKAKLSKAITVRYATSNIAPGHLQNHYQPKKPLVLLSSSDLNPRLLKQIKNKLKISKDAKFATLHLESSATLAARTLYSQMRQLEAMEIDLIIVEFLAYQNKPSFLAIQDRLTKAASLVV
ncbi:MAG: threonylcarbamoyl-AMP synthase [Deltaproteobacteria bacterium]|jgi:L-threonylcarbamoyladenylate synthase|nr:threonylcarbamoyl-AMP synthase [Deltaproteobacteria bacterium]